MEQKHRLGETRGLLIYLLFVVLLKLKLGKLNTGEVYYKRVKGLSVGYHLRETHLNKLIDLQELLEAWETVFLSLWIRFKKKNKKYKNIFIMNCYS